MDDDNNESAQEQPPTKRRKNQHLPAPPDDQLLPWIQFYWNLKISDTKMSQQIMDHFDRDHKYTVKRRRESIGLLSARKRAATWEEIAPFYEVIRKKFPNMGARGMVTVLRQEHKIKVPEEFMAQAFKLIEPAAVQRRKQRRFRRKRFWAAGVMDILCFDQHDKWQRFGLWLHLGLDPFSGRIAWFRIWWTNRNGRLITSYYINACREIGGIPLITQSDPGSENYGIANCHTVTRQRLDPSLEGSLQHRWMNKKAMNVKPEAMWSQFRRQFAPGFEDILDEGINRGLYNINRPLDKLVFRWLAIPWLQREIDAWVKRFNSTTRRADKHKILPHGIPDLIASKPESFATKDYKVVITSELFDEMEETWAKPSDPVFDLTPPSFDKQATSLYAQLGNPEVNIDTFWIAYSQLLNAFETAADVTLDDVMANADDHFEHAPQLIPDQQPPRAEEEEEEVEFDLDNLNFDPREYAEFTDDEADFD
ncbi:hypothetical protein FB451DRAFT_1342284 [Mycena latifolia]|nr:hypothetical protein FB451DRAFT_1342284 [Mycena latifolia]